MAVKGDQRPTGDATKYVGLTQVEFKAFNPTREELNKILGKEDSDKDEPITYLGQDKEGNDRVRMTFWLQDPILNKNFVHSFNITNKIRKNKDETKIQYVNSTLGTTWCPTLEAGSDEADESQMADWFLEFQDKEKNKTGNKIVRKAYLGEEELATFLRAALGKLNFSKPTTEVTYDVPALFKEDWREIREMLETSYVTPIVILLGVRTDENDDTKQYQQVYNKAFLPNGFMQYFKSGSFDSKGDTYAKKAWDKFEKGVTDVDYGFTSHYELVPVKPYDPEEDVAAAPAKPEVTAKNKRY